MNEFFQPGAVPAPSSPGSSAVIRQEFANIAAGFDKLPVLTGHAGEIVFVDPTGSRLETDGTVVTDFVTLIGTQELINKTIAWASNTFTGFNDAATKVAGTGAGEVLLLAEADKLPALDGSLLTNLNQGSLSTVSIAKGGTGATDLTGAQANLGINLKADANNAVLTGAPTAPTPLTGDASARIATTYFVADTMQAIGAFGPSSMNPLMNGTAAPGVAILGSRSDHVHPTDTSRVSRAGDTIGGVITLSGSGGEGGELRLLNTTHGKEITFDQVADALNTSARLFWDGGATLFSFDVTGLRQSMVQGTDVSHLTRKDYVDTYAIAPLALKAPLASPTFTGDPKAPTPLTSDNDTSIATTAFVQSLLAQQPPAGMQPSNSTPLMDGTAAAGTGVEGSRYDHVHPSDTSRAPVASPNFTGTPTAPTPAVGANNSQIATAAHVADRQYRKNLLINGEVTRVNQKGFNGDWGTLTIWSSGFNNGQKYACYGYDQWFKESSTTIGQFIEGGRYIPNTTYTLSGVGVTTQQLTSPASGNWKIVVPNTATNVQLELGVEATSFEFRPLPDELLLCYRYFHKPIMPNAGMFSIGGIYSSAGIAYHFVAFPVVMYGVPGVTQGTFTLINCTLGGFPPVSQIGYSIQMSVSAAGAASAQLNAGSYPYQAFSLM